MILNYMHNNSLGPDAATMALLLNPGCHVKIMGVCVKRQSEEEYIAGMTKWAGLVCQGCPWDQKPELLDLFNMDLADLDSLMMDVPGTRLRVNYDVWSNIHYGYVGTHIGIDKQSLISAQNLPSNPVTGRRDQSDAIAVEIGIRLRQQYKPQELTQQVVVSALLSQLPALEATGERKVLPQK